MATKSRIRKRPRKLRIRNIADLQVMGFKARNKSLAHFWKVRKKLAGKLSAKELESFDSGREILQDGYNLGPYKNTQVKNARG